MSNISLRPKILHYYVVKILGRGRTPRLQWLGKEGMISLLVEKLMFSFPKSIAAKRPVSFVLSLVINSSNKNALFGSKMAVCQQTES